MTRARAAAAKNTKIAAAETNNNYADRTLSQKQQYTTLYSFDVII